MYYFFDDVNPLLDSNFTKFPLLMINLKLLSYSFKTHLNRAYTLFFWVDIRRQFYQVPTSHDKF